MLTEAAAGETGDRLRRDPKMKKKHQSLLGQEHEWRNQRARTACGAKQDRYEVGQVQEHLRSYSLRIQLTNSKAPALGVVMAPGGKEGRT